MKKGFTLAELLIVMVILAVLASIAMPSYSGLVEKEKRNQGAAYLRILRAAQRVYKANNGTYLRCNNYTTCSPASGSGSMTTLLGVELTQENFTFSTSTSSAALATATRTSGAQKDKTIIINEAGTFSGSYRPLPT